LVLQLHRFSTGERATVRGDESTVFGLSCELQVSPLIWPVGHLLSLAKGRRDMENVPFESTSVWTA